MPAAQLVQELRPDPLYLPGAQVEQEVAALNPALYLPPVPARSELAITESKWARETGRKLSGRGRGPSRRCNPRAKKATQVRGALIRQFEPRAVRTLITSEAVVSFEGAGVCTAFIASAACG